MRFLIFSISLIMAISAWGQNGGGGGGGRGGRGGGGHYSISGSANSSNNSSDATASGGGDAGGAVRANEQSADVSLTAEEQQALLSIKRKKNSASRGQWRGIVSSALNQAQVTESGSSAASLQSAPTKSAESIKPRIIKKTFSLTAIDRISKLASQSENLSEFLIEMNTYLLPGDEVFIENLIKRYPKIAKSKDLPIISQDKGLITLKSDSGEYSLRRKSEEKFEFDINGVNINFDPGYGAHVRWKTISKVPQINSVSLISFMPLASATDEYGEPTISNIVLFTMLSRYAKANSILKTKLRAGNKSVFIDKIWTVSKALKGLAAKMNCTTDLLVTMSQKLAEINASSISCHRGAFRFELPSEDMISSHKYRLDRSGKNLDLIIGEEKSVTHFHKSLEVESDNSLSRASNKKVLRMKGARWKVDNRVADDQKISIAEHVRELVNYAGYTEFCELCENFLNKAIIQAIKIAENEELELVNSGKKKSKVSTLGAKDSLSIVKSPQNLSSDNNKAPNSNASAVFDGVQVSPQDNSQPSPSQQPPPPAQDLGAPQMMDLPPDMK